MDFSNVPISEELAVRIMVYEIRDKNPESVRFTVNQSAVKSILFCLKIKAYTTLIYSFGIGFVLELLDLCEEVENYEECAEIMKQVNEFNELVNKAVKC